MAEPRSREQLRERIGESQAPAVINPTLLVEVTSSSTENYDRGESIVIDSLALSLSFDELYAGIQLELAPA